MTESKTYEEENEDEMMHQFALQCFEAYCNNLNDKKRHFSKEFKIASASGFVTALRALGYIPLKEAEDLFKTFETQFEKR